MTKSCYRRRRRHRCRCGGKRRSTCRKGTSVLTLVRSALKGKKVKVRKG